MQKDPSSFNDLEDMRKDVDALGEMLDKASPRPKAKTPTRKASPSKPIAKDTPTPKARDGHEHRTPGRSAT